MRSRTALALCALACAALLGDVADAQSASGGATLDEIDTMCVHLSSAQTS